jgi:hypothetical protein
LSDGDSSGQSVRELNETRVRVRIRGSRESQFDGRRTGVRRRGRELNGFIDERMRRRGRRSRGKRLRNIGDEVVSSVGSFDRGGSGSGVRNSVRDVALRERSDRVRDRLSVLRLNLRNSVDVNDSISSSSLLLLRVVVVRLLLLSHRYSGIGSRVLRRVSVMSRGKVRETVAIKGVLRRKGKGGFFKHLELNRRVSLGTIIDIALVNNLSIFDPI